MRIAFSLSLLVLALGCVTEKERIPPPTPPALHPGIPGFLEQEAALVADEVVLQAHIDLREKVTYRVNRNFHQFQEGKDQTRTVMILDNVSSIATNPVFFQIGKIKIAGTQKIRAIFDPAIDGLIIQAVGLEDQAFWSQGGKETRARKIWIENGQVRWEN